MMGTLRFAHPTSSASALGCGIHPALGHLFWSFGGLCLNFYQKNVTIQHYIQLRHQ